MKTLKKINAVLLVMFFVFSIQSCHIGLGLGIDAAKEKNASEKKSDVTSKATETDSTKTAGPTISK